MIVTSERAYYSLIQFCPDSSRLEAANIGVLLYCPGRDFIKAEVSKGNRRVKRFFGEGSFDRVQLNSFKKAFCRRFELERDAFRTTEDVERFISTRANQLRMTPLRPMRCSDPDAELRSLFIELVGGHAFRTRESVSFPELRTAFKSPELFGRIEFEKEVVVPTVGKKVTVPYAYRNGVMNLIRTCGFTGSPDEAVKRAEIVAVDGHLLRKHSCSTTTGMELVVVSRFSPALESVQSRIAGLFDDLGVQHFPGNRLSELIEKVRREARPIA